MICPQNEIMDFPRNEVLSCVEDWAEQFKNDLRLDTNTQIRAIQALCKNIRQPSPVVFLGMLFPLQYSILIFFHIFQVIQEQQQTRLAKAGLLTFLLEALHSKDGNVQVWAATALAHIVDSNPIVANMIVELEGSV
jgi:hypothetical protein